MKKEEKRKREKMKGIDRSKIEKIKTPPKKDNPNSTHAASMAGLCPLFITPVTPVVP